MQVEDEFVMHLQQHPRPARPFFKFVVYPCHGQLDQVGRRALYAGIDGDALLGALGRVVPGIYVPQVPAPARHGLDESVLLGELDRFVHVLARPRILGEVLVDQFLALSPRDVEPFGESEGGDAVDDTEIDGLGAPAHLVGHAVGVHVIDLHGRRRVDVLVLDEGLHHALVPAELGRDAQFDLGIVRGHQEVVVVPRHEGLADLAAHLRADRYGLKVGSVGLDPARGDHGLFVGGMHAPRPGKYGMGQLADVHRIQLGAHTVVEDLLHDLVLGRQPSQYGFRRRILARLGRALGVGIDLQLVEEDVPELFRRIEIHGFPGQLGDPVRGPLDLFIEQAGQVLELAHVHPHAFVLHFHESGHQWAFDIREDGILVHLADPGPQEFGQLQRDIRVFGRILHDLFQRRILQRTLILALLPDEGGDGDRRIAQEGLRQIVHGPAQVRHGHVGRQHGVEDAAGHGDPVPPQHGEVELDVVPDELLAGVVEKGLEFAGDLQYLLPALRHGYVIACMRFDREGESQDFAGLGIQARRFHVETEGRRLAK